MTRYMVFDDEGTIHESNDYEEAYDEYETTEEFTGDLIFAEILGVRR